MDMSLEINLLDRSDIEGGRHAFGVWHSHLMQGLSGGQGTPQVTARAGSTDMDLEGWSFEFNGGERVSRLKIGVSGVVGGLRSRFLNVQFTEQAEVLFLDEDWDSARKAYEIHVLEKNSPDGHGPVFEIVYQDGVVSEMCCLSREAVAIIMRLIENQLNSDLPDQVA